MNLVPMSINIEVRVRRAKPFDCGVSTATATRPSSKNALFSESGSRIAGPINLSWARWQKPGSRCRKKARPVVRSQWGPLLEPGRWAKPDDNSPTPQTSRSAGRPPPAPVGFSISSRSTRRRSRSGEAAPTAATAAGHDTTRPNRRRFALPGVFLALLSCIRANPKLLIRR